ncbi:hypothetical protein GCM10009678_81300 [Actinomadura kijaniata]
MTSRLGRSGTRIESRHCRRYPCTRWTGTMMLSERAGPEFIQWANRLLDGRAEGSSLRVNRPWSAGVPTEAP